MSVLSACVSPVEEVRNELAADGKRMTREGTASMLLSLRPDVPVLPDFPLNLAWGYCDSSGLYTLDEEGVDRLLDYRDNALRRYREDWSLYEIQLDTIVERITELGL